MSETWDLAFTPSAEDVESFVEVDLTRYPAVRNPAAGILPGIAAFLIASGRVTVGASVAAVGLYSAAVRVFLARRHLARFRARSVESVSPPREFRVRVDRDGFHTVTDEGTSDYHFDQISVLHRSTSGLVFYWRSGSSLWLPDRAFRDADDREALVAFVASSRGKDAPVWRIETSTHRSAWQRFLVP
jgi:hypothetical protein